MSKANELKYGPLLASTGARYGLRPEFLVALGHKESAFNPDAKVLTGTDGARGGAFGLLQMTYKTAQGLGFKGAPEGLLYPDVNAEYGAMLAVDHMKRFKLSAEMVMALACCHNAGRPLTHIDNPLTYAKVKAYGDDAVRLCEVYREAYSQYAKK